MFEDLIYRLRALFRRKKLEEELDEELRFHFDRQVEQFLESGMPRREALRRARMALGGFDQIKEECRQARGVSALETAMQDIRYSLRGLRRAPAYALVAIVTLALTTGALATSFNLAYGFFFRPLPVEQAYEVVAVTATRRHGAEYGFVSYPDYLRFRNARTLWGLAAHYSTAPLFAVSRERSQEINGAVVSANFFPLLGIQPAHGRFFNPQEDSVPGRDPVAVLGHRLWRDWFDSSPAVLGGNLKLNGVDFTIIGVAPDSFRGLSISPSQVYIPTMMLRTGYRWCDAFSEDCTVLSMVGRLAEGRTVEQARAEIESLMPARWRRADEGENSGVRVERWRGVRHGPSESRLIRLLISAAGLLLLVGCANLAGLSIARGSARAREFAIRGSLGAGRFRLIRQSMTESLLLALGGGILGTIASLTLTNALQSRFFSMDSEGHRLFYDFSPAPGVVLAVLASSVVAGLLFGLPSALRVTRRPVKEALASRPRWNSQRSALRNWLVGAQSAAAMALATVAALLSASADAVLEGVNFEPSGVALMRLRPRLLEYPPEKAQRFLGRAVERLESLPGVESVSLWGHPGSALWGPATDVWLPQWPEGEEQALRAGYGEIGPRFFETLGVPLPLGREFSRSDSLNSEPVAVVTETLARRLWPEGEVIGSSLELSGGPRRVVGVVADVPLQSRAEPVRPRVYVPFWQNPDQVDARVCVRVQGDPGAMLPELAREVNRVDPDVPISETLPMDQQVAGMFRPLRVSAAFIAFAAALSVFLSGVGLYGALAFAVASRGREMGIRMAVGAKPGGVRNMVVGEGLKLVSAGIAAGAGLALAGIRLVRHLLVGSPAADPAFLSAAALLVAAVGVLACWLPAQRAASVDPAIALRNE